MSTQLPTAMSSDEPMGTRATNDEMLVESWLQSLGPVTKKKFTATACRFLEFLERRSLTLRTLTVEDLREAIEEISAGAAESTKAQYAQRLKSLCSYAHRLGYTRFNPGAAVRVKAPAGLLSKRIICEAEVALLMRSLPPRDRLMLGVAYAAGLRVSEIVGMMWGDIVQRDDGTVQIAVRGKGGKVRQVLLPNVIGFQLASARLGAPASRPVFASRNGRPLTSTEVNKRIKRAAARAGVNPGISAHWLRHAHASHALARGASLVEVKETLGHLNVATTSGYLHARPGSSSGQKLDDSVF